MAVNGEGYAGDHSSLGAGGLGFRQGSRISAPCATHKPCLVRQDASPQHYFDYTAPEETATVEDDI